MKPRSHFQAANDIKINFFRFGWMAVAKIFISYIYKVRIKNNIIGKSDTIEWHEGMNIEKFTHYMCALRI